MNRLDGVLRANASDPVAGQTPGTDGLPACEVVLLPIAGLLPGEPVRSGGHDVEHVMRLADLDDHFPPILVERRTMRVIDGTHRLLAAILQGRETIAATYYDGPGGDAFLRAVERNVAHGLPLSPADRRAAVERILTTHPALSDRAIARIAGLGAKAVAAIRKRSTAAGAHLDSRVGRDGRVRPVDATAGRLRVAELVAENPEISVRDLARTASVSPGTASKVRQRLREGMGPLPSPPAGVGPRPAGQRPVAEGAHGRRFRLVRSDPAELLEKLVRDPSLRLKEEGRLLLRLLRQNSLWSQERSELTAAVPPHHGAMVAGLARQYAAVWQEFAQELDDRMRSLDTRAPGQRPVRPPIRKPAAPGSADGTGPLTPPSLGTRFRDHRADRTDAATDLLVKQPLGQDGGEVHDRGLLRIERNARVTRRRPPPV
ncbi:transcriptional regulator [Kitasatospora sp. CB01950]|uniref:transcriptional regulator n=1 Tax=Kitasatospora sp. CB01950 TaxID=1703930 RepID=UPI0018EA116E|nr:transcriptional regulator [Kitasatospora sp. CB01950]